ncbi:MAG: c-type cytochrome, partial [Rhodospirillaceae bacterium]|nr:c-type cytochrome [Rhodospirillaceae bacterium]
YGVRNRDCPEDQMAYGACADTRYSEMPGYGQLGFPENLLGDLVEWVVAMSGGEADAVAVERAQASVSICSECHGADGYGYVPYGGPSLRDDIWLYGDDRDTIYDVIANGRLGVCPPWAETLDAATIKSLAVYIWNTSLGL